MIIIKIPHSDIYNLYQNNMFVGGSSFLWNRIGGVMYNALASSAVDRGFGRVKPKTIKLVFVASPLSTQH